MSEEPEYLFRGTTKGYEGGTNCRTYNYTCTSAHPIIALYFAMECSNYFPEQAVVYVAKVEKGKHLKAASNVLKKIEEEFVLQVAPSDFYLMTEGYIHYRDLQGIFNEMGFNVTQVVKKENLSELCSGVLQLSYEMIKLLVSRIEDVIVTI